MESVLRERLRDLAHDMRSPLQVMEGLVAVLERTTPDHVDEALTSAAKRCVERLKLVADTLSEMGDPLENSH